MNVHEAVDNLVSLISLLDAIGAITNDESNEAYDALRAISEYVRINEGGTTND